MEKEQKKKNMIQDIVPNRRTIRSVEIPSRSKKPQNKLSDVLPSEEIISQKTVKPFVYDKKEVPENNSENIRQNNIPPASSSYRYEYGQKKKSSKLSFYVSLLVLLLVCAFGISSFFKGAKITITPKNETHTIDSSLSFNAKKDETGADLGFQVVTITKDVEKSVPSDGEAKVSKKASGKIVIYNNTTATQKLVILTRFQSPDGLVFKSNTPVTIPGSQLKNGKSIPGSVEVTVTADEVGDKYNIGLVDFTIPGFKGSSKYTQIYAKSKTEMSGGFVGMQKTVSEDLKSSTDTELQKNLKTVLASSIALQIPDNFILYDNGISYEFSPTTQVDSKDSNAILQKKGVAHAIIFDKGSLTRSIVAKVLPDVKDDIVKITNLDKLVFSYKNPDQFNPTSSESIDFNLSGDALFVWVYDENKLKSDLLGLSKKQATAIISSYQSIKEAWITTEPFWNQTIPKDPKDVTIIDTLSK